MVAHSLPRALAAVGRTAACALAVLLLMAPLASAQTNTQATIEGVVTDESGAVLPGVTVTATSPNLQVGQMTAVTGSSGEYRIGPLPIGTYQVTYALEGFQQV